MTSQMDPAPGRSTSGGASGGPLMRMKVRPKEVATILSRSHSEGQIALAGYPTGWPPHFPFLLGLKISCRHLVHFGS